MTTATDSLGTTWGYTYDNIGNRLTKTVTGTGAESWTYSYVPNGASGNTPVLEDQVDATREMPVIHDLDGNMTELRLDTGGGGSDLVVGMEYTDEMTLAAHAEGGVESTYRYDADGYLARIMRNDGGEFSNAHLVYDHRGRLLGIMHPDQFSELDRVFIYAEGTPIAMLLGSPAEKATVYNIITDHLGTPLLYFRNEQQYTRPWYTPFGEITDVEEVGSAAPPLDLRFPGQVDFSSAVSDWPTYYNVHRWYLPDWGRYSQSDPIGLAGGINLFLYAEANPLRFVDPLGLVCGIKIGSEGYASGGGGASRYDHMWLEWPGTFVHFYPNFAIGCGNLSGPGSAVVVDGPYNGLRDEQRMLDTAWRDPGSKCNDCDEARDCLVEFTNSYDREYAFVGNNCHDFVSDAMAKCGLIAAPFWPVGLP